MPGVMEAQTGRLVPDTSSGAPRDELRLFLDALWPEGSIGDQWVLFWSLPDKRSEWTQTITEDTLDMLEAWAQKENVYLGCGLSGQNFGPRLRCQAKDITAIPGVWLDCDYGKDHRKPNLPPTEEDAMALIQAMGPPPTMIVHSGHGLQAWWLFKEPWVFESEAEHEKAKALTKGWIATLRSRAHAKGWDQDAVWDLARVMRLPGLWNRKGTPCATRLLICEDERRYDPSDFDDYLVTATEASEPRPNIKLKFELSPAAEPPADKFKLLCDNDPQFNLSWMHARTDLQDQSASSYDLALANKAYAANWNTQEVVNLIIACRRKHGADLKMRRDYYERTLAKALSRKEGVEELKARGSHEADEEGTDRPTINAQIQDLPTITRVSWSAVEAANRPSRLFLFGGLPTRLETNPDGSTNLRELTLDRLRHETARAARWIKRDKDRASGAWVEKDAKPPTDVIKDMLACPDIPLPHLVRVVETPVFGRSGALLHAPGYHQSDRVYYAATPHFDIPCVALEPTQAEIDAARHLLLDDLLGDFPFVSESGRAHALAGLLLPFVRDLIDGPTPLHLIEKPTPRTGGTLLASMLVLPAVGRAVTHVTEAHDTDEWRKVITALLMGSPVAICVDNIRRRLEAASLASALTATVWTDRLLGHSEKITVPARAMWLATGNNPSLSDEMLGRTVFIRLDARVDRPQERTGFRHRLPEWAMAQRGALIHAALVLCQSWIVAGRPLGQASKGGFEDWSAVLGGILAHVGVSGFLTERDSDLVDPETLAWNVFIHLWWARFHDEAVGVADLFDLVNPLDRDPIDLGLPDGSPRSQKICLGKRLIERRDRQFSLESGHRVRLVPAKTIRRAQLWQLKQVVGPAHLPCECVNECEYFSTQESDHVAATGGESHEKV